MNKIVNIGLVAGLTLFIVGCSAISNKIKLKNQQTVLVEDKKYVVPYGVIHTNAPVTNKAIDFYKKIGIKECHYGDITWEDKVTAEAINKIMRRGTKEEGIALYTQAAKEGRVGCSSPQN